MGARGFAGDGDIVGASDGGGCRIYCGLLPRAIVCLATKIESNGLGCSTTRPFSAAIRIRWRSRNGRRNSSANSETRGEGEALFWVGTVHQVVRDDGDTAIPFFERSYALAGTTGDKLTLSSPNSTTPTASSAGSPQLGGELCGQLPPLFPAAEARTARNSRNTLRSAGNAAPPRSSSAVNRSRYRRRSRPDTTFFNSTAATNAVSAASEGSIRSISVLPRRHRPPWPAAAP